VAAGFRSTLKVQHFSGALCEPDHFSWSTCDPLPRSFTARELRARSFILDSEAWVCGPDSVAIFDALHRHGTVSEAMLYAFDLLVLDGEDLRARQSSVLIGS
jgi:hypothetical protein